MMTQADGGSMIREIGVRRFDGITASELKMQHCSRLIVFLP
jgi:hypothetical protein